MPIVKPLPVAKRQYTLEEKETAVGMYPRRSAVWLAEMLACEPTRIKVWVAQSRRGSLHSDEVLDKIWDEEEMVHREAQEAKKATRTKELKRRRKIARDAGYTLGLSASPEDRARKEAYDHFYAHILPARRKRARRVFQYGYSGPPGPREKLKSEILREAIEASILERESDGGLQMLRNDLSRFHDLPYKKKLRLIEQCRQAGISVDDYVQVLHLPLDPVLPRNWQEASSEEEDTYLAYFLRNQDLRDEDFWLLSPEETRLAIRSVQGLQQ